MVAIGAAQLAVKTGWERSHLTKEFTRLTRITGDLPIGNRSQVHVQAWKQANRGSSPGTSIIPPATSKW